MKCLGDFVGASHRVPLVKRRWATACDVTLCRRLGICYLHSPVAYLTSMDDACQKFLSLRED